MSQSKLVTYTKWSPYYGYGGHGRGGEKIENIVVHHMAGNLTVKQCGQVFQSAGASTHYAVNGKNIGQFVKEEDAAWSCGSKWWNQNSISIELANDSGAPNWHVSDQTIATAIKLIADICKRNNIKEIIYTGDKWGNLIMHKWIASTACPGTYLASKFPYIAKEVNKLLNVGKKEGFVKEGGKYYLYESGKKRTKTGFYTYKGKKVYVQKNGSLKHYVHAKIGGKEYVFAKATPTCCLNAKTTIRKKYFESDKDGVVKVHQFWDSTTTYKQASYPETKTNGCLPTSLAMIVTDLTRKKVTPPQVAKFLKNAGKWDSEKGGAGDGIRVAAINYDLKYKYYPAADYKKALAFMEKHNALMIVRQHKGTFTDGTHFIAIAGIEGDKALVHNPGKKGKNGTYSFEKAVKPYLYDAKGTNNEAICVLWKER